jgi:hypothetical protein
METKSPQQAHTKRVHNNNSVHLHAWQSVQGRFHVPSAISSVRCAVCNTFADNPHVLPLGAVVVVDGHAAGAAHAMAAEVAVLLRRVRLQQALMPIIRVLKFVTRKEASTCAHLLGSHQHHVMQAPLAVGVKQRQPAGQQAQMLRVSLKFVWCRKSSHSRACTWISSS